MKTFNIFLLMIFLSYSCSKPEHDLMLKGRSRVKTGENAWEEKVENLHWEPANTAIIVCDMWDHHWCKGAESRVSAMAPYMNKVLEHARKKGITVIHAPSGTMDFYDGYPQRERMKNAVYDPSSNGIKSWYYLDPDKEAGLPVDDSDGGCETNPEPMEVEVWTRQIPDLKIDDGDGISDNGSEINNFFIENDIRNVILMGVHINMCVLGRSFGVRGQKALGRNVVIVRDLTDSMYNPDMPPFVSHEEGTRLVIGHIERYWCESIESKDLL